MVSDAQQGNGAAPAPVAAAPELERGRPGGRGSAPNPLTVVAGGLAVGYLLAKAIYWRGHAHPRR